MATTRKSERGRKAEHAGRLAETLAALSLAVKFYRIAARRFRCPAGEIDLIARNPAGVLCFVEVKRRASDAAAVAAVGPHQRRRIRKAAEIFLAGKKPPRGVRFDVISVAPGRWPRHIRDAWRPDE
jgi:putative endonuclease